MPDIEQRAKWTRRGMYLIAGLLTTERVFLPLNAPLEARALLLLAALLVAVATLVSYLWWLQLAVRWACALDPALDDTPAYSVASYFIPVLNLFAPFSTLRRIAPLAPVTLWQISCVAAAITSAVSVEGLVVALDLLRLFSRLAALISGAEVVRVVTQRVAPAPDWPASPS
jgi:hypothetical protein